MRKEGCAAREAVHNWVKSCSVWMSAAVCVLGSEHVCQCVQDGESRYLLWCFPQNCGVPSVPVWVCAWVFLVLLRRCQREGRVLSTHRHACIWKSTGGRASWFKGTQWSSLRETLKYCRSGLAAAPSCQLIDYWLSSGSFIFVVWTKVWTSELNQKQIQTVEQQTEV